MQSSHLTVAVSTTCVGECGLAVGPCYSQSLGTVNTVLPSLGTMNTVVSPFWILCTPSFLFCVGTVDLVPPFLKLRFVDVGPFLWVL